ncbi:hypothetical protein IT570_02975 [Candidatus Sumerlaeota bacterium]|nr:hypothetical protein [Candidatus Sumerlaeota bacterium]
MDELKRKIAAIRFRLKLFRAIDWALWALIGALTALCLTFLILNLFSNSVDRVIVASSLVGGALVVAIIAGLSRRLTLFEAALQADSRLKLRERISSAVLLREVHQDDTEAYRALEEDAKRYAAAIRISKDFPYKFPRHGWHTAWPAIGLIALYFMPQFDLLGMANSPAAKKTEQPTLTAEERKKKAEPLQELAKKARAQEAEEIAAAKDDLKLADKLERLAEDVSKGAKNEKEALAEMSRMNDDAKLKQREMNAQMQPFKQIKGLQDANQTREMQKDLKDQDFKAAAEKMQQLAQQMMNPEQMSAEDKKELAQEMENLAQQLKDNPQMADAMQKAAEAIKQAADQQSQAQGQQKEDSSGATPQNQQGGQKEQKQTADGGQQQSQQQQQANQQNGGQSSKSDAASQQKAQQAAQAAQAALQQAAQQMQNMQDMQQQMQQLSEMQKQMAQTMASSMAGSSQSQSGSQGANPQSGQQGSQPGQQPGGQQPGQGQGQSSSGQGQGNMNGPGNFQKGMSDQQGQNGPGGLGRGSGFRPDSGAAAQGFVDTFIPGQKNEGQIIAVFDVDAPAPKGESNLRYTSVPAAYQQRAADALTDTEIPVGMRNSVKDYFERINFGKQGDGAPPQQSAPAPPQPAKTQ